MSDQVKRQNNVKQRKAHHLHSVSGPGHLVWLTESKDDYCEPNIQLGRYHYPNIQAQEHGRVIKQSVFSAMTLWTVNKNKINF